MDKLPAHKSAPVRRAIDATGAEPRLLSPYSPDFNPIENAFAELKAACEKLQLEPSPHSNAPSPRRRPRSNGSTRPVCHGDRRGKKGAEAKSPQRPLTQSSFYLETTTWNSLLDISRPSVALA